MEHIGYVNVNTFGWTRMFYANYLDQQSYLLIY